MIHKPKPLQARKSILEISESSSKLEEPPAKRAKRDDTAVSNQLRRLVIIRIEFFNMATLYRVIWSHDRNWPLAQWNYFYGSTLKLGHCSHVTVMWCAPPTYRVPSVRRRAVWSQPMGTERGRGLRNRPMEERRALDRAPQPAQQTQTMKVAHRVARRWIPPSLPSLRSSGERPRAPSRHVPGLTSFIFTPQQRRRRWPHKLAR